MGYPELSGSTVHRPRRARPARAAPHQHGPAVEGGASGDADGTLVQLSIAVQAACEPCVEHHAAAAGDRDVPRQQLLEALGTALLLSTARADRWPRLADVALRAHEEAMS